MPKQIGSLKLYTVEELSEILEVQEKTIREYLKDGRLQGRKLAGRWYVTEEQIRGYFEEPEQPGEATPPSQEETLLEVEGYREWLQERGQLNKANLKQYQAWLKKELAKLQREA